SDSEKMEQLDADDSSWRQLAQRFKLSARQAKVLRLLMQGEEQKVIGRKIRCTRNTVNTHVHRIYEKFGVTSAVQLAIRVAEFFSGLSPNGDRD
ncbi:MAG: helix-turn-helix transcriptional regulator, partial [Acidobacteriales bacterium]|nr:helix-turn-helix transcriptional regulator [Terriglobales bacterium]